jgi:hypothetical protein
VAQWPSMSVSSRSAIAAIACLLFALTNSVGSIAWAANEKFAVTSAYLAPVQGVFVLNAKLHFVLPDGARQAVRDGVALTLSVDMELQRARRWWLNATIATLEQRYEVVYHALSEQYLLRNLNSGEQAPYPTLDAAIEAMSVIHDLPALDQSLLDPAQAYEVRLRATLDVRTLPETLRIVLFWTDNWRQRTDWYLWPLKQ